MIKFYTDYWQGVKELGEEIENPSWEKVESAINLLNQREKTQVVLKLEDWSNISIGGGNGKYHVCFTTPDERFFVLNEPNKKDMESTEELVVGGQIGNYPSPSIVSLNLVIKAAKFYFEYGKINKELSWTEE